MVKMAVKIVGKDIDRFLVIDDDEAMRETEVDLISDMGVDAVSVTGPLGPISYFIDYKCGGADAAIADFHLRPFDYASFDGAELVAAWYDRRFPALLCTRFEQSDIDEIRVFRKRIPVLLTPDNLNIDNIMKGVETTLNEFEGEYLASRRGWRTLVRIEEIDIKAGFIYLIIPAWNPNDGIKLRTISWPKHIADLSRLPISLYAEVNLNAEKQEELYLDNWALDR
jgi:hypothetical protein